MLDLFSQVFCRNSSPVVFIACWNENMFPTGVWSTACRMRPILMINTSLQAHNFNLADARGFPQSKRGVNWDIERFSNTDWLFFFFPMIPLETSSTLTSSSQQNCLQGCVVLRGFMRGLVPNLFQIFWSLWSFLGGGVWNCYHYLVWTNAEVMTDYSTKYRVRLF